MMLQEKPLMEVIQMALLKRARQKRSKVKVFLPGKYLPPKEIRVHRTVRVSTIYGQVEIYCRPVASPPGWEFFVRFKEEPTPVLDPKQGEELLKKMNSK